MKNIENKVVIITGATSGIGEAAARALIDNGAKVVLSGRREDRLEKLVNELGSSAIYLKSDVTKVEDMKAIVKLAKEKFGKIDVLFANAGIMPAGNMSELDIQGWMNMIDINIKGVLNSMYSVIILKQIRKVKIYVQRQFIRGQSKNNILVNHWHTKDQNT